MWNQSTILVSRYLLSTILRFLEGSKCWNISSVCLKWRVSEVGIKQMFQISAAARQRDQLGNVSALWCQSQPLKYTLLVMPLNLLGFNIFSTTKLVKNYSSPLSHAIFSPFSPKYFLGNRQKIITSGFWGLFFNRRNVRHVIFRVI